MQTKYTSINIFNINCFQENNRKKHFIHSYLLKVIFKIKKTIIKIIFCVYPIIIALIKSFQIKNRDIYLMIKILKKIN